MFRFLVLKFNHFPLSFPKFEELLFFLSPKVGVHFFFSLMKRKSSQKEKSRLRLNGLKLLRSG